MTPQEIAKEHFERGLAALEAEDPREAIECFTQAIDLAPNISAGYRYRAKAHLAKHDRPAAIKDFNEAVRLKPDDPTPRIERAAELYRQRTYDAAIEDCNKALAIDEGRSDAIGIRGRCRAEIGKSEEALQDFAAAIAGDPENAPMYFVLRGRLLRECGRITEARAEATAALQLDSEFVLAQQLLQALEEPV